jgi:meso-butanediol dehydrogenase/(S,S)-butanediol dehydrogenase/diacetyl reductase
MGVLAGKVAIVTGSGRGIGRGIALALAAEGARVAVVERNRTTLDATVRLLAERDTPGLGVACDVQNSADVSRAVTETVDHFGTVDILVNNAQTFPLGRLLDVDDADAEAGWESGPLATLRFMRECHPHLRGGGSIVNISSGAASIPDPSSMGVYGAVKSATLSLSRTAAIEWADDGIRVNVVYPASTSHTEAAHTTLPPEIAAKMRDIPLGRLGDAEHDIGRGVVFLCSDDATFITGAVLAIDGGWSYLR